tara:strand:+ start:1587 stop:1937 length:351 start_codon:yes stop_codon:yes gene_type:complete
MNEDFQKNIQDWVQLDNEIKRANNHIKTLRNNKHNLSDKIMAYADEYNLEDAVIEISDGSLKFQNYKQTAPLTLKFVQQCLSECINNEESVKNLMEYIKNKREFKMKNDIKRSYKN